MGPCGLPKRLVNFLRAQIIETQIFQKEVWTFQDFQNNNFDFALSLINDNMHSKSWSMHVSYKCTSSLAENLSKFSCASSSKASTFS